LFGYIQTQGQVPEGFNYQAVARDASGNVRSNETILVRLTLQPGVSATPTWIETHSALTDGYGVFTLTIGAGTQTGGTSSSFAALDFSGGDYWIKVEVKEGSNYLIVGSLQKFLTVPYAMVSKTTLNNNDADADSTNELQILKLSNDTLFLDRGGFVFLGSYDDKIEIQNLKNKHNADSNYLKGLINSNTSNISNEANSRITSDNNLKSKQIADSTYLKGQITTETNTRISGDNSIRGKMVSDSTSLRNIVNTTTTNLTTETNSRISGDQNLKTKQVSDSTYLKGLISTETTNRGNADITLQSNITTETNLRINGDNSIRSKMSSDSSSMRTIVNTTTTNLTNETNSRITGDNNLKSKEVSDSSFLKGLINTSTTNLTNETNSRITGDNNLKTKIVSDSTFLKGLIIPVREVADEFTATAAQTSFTLTQTPSANSKVKMYINGVRISNTAYTKTGNALTYVPANNGSYVLVAGDRIQFDYYY
jgi:hypothetical protein